MCDFFSFCSDGKKYLYSDWNFRKAHLQDKENVDSHTTILTYAEIEPVDQDKWSCYEYNPITGVFVADKIVKGHDPQKAGRWVKRLDFAKVVPAMVIKPIVNPLLIKRSKVTKIEIRLLKKWASVMAIVGDSVWASVMAIVWASVRDSVWASVGASVRDSVGDSVWASVWDSVRDSVWASVGDSVWASVEASVRAYISSFVDIKYKYDFSSAIKLWEAGLVLSFDGKTWRLHAGPKAEIVYEMPGDGK